MSKKGFPLAINFKSRIKKEQSRDLINNIKSKTGELQEIIIYKALQMYRESIDG